MSGQIAENLGLPEHTAAMDWLLDLVVDLKLQLAGRPPRRPVTMERLNEATKHYDDLGRCRRPPFYS